MKKERANIVKLEEFVLKALPQELWEEVFKNSGATIRTRVFPWAVVIWLMIWQRLSKGGSLASTISAIRVGTFEGAYRSSGASYFKISGSTGGYSQARSRLPLKLVESSVDKIHEQIQELHAEQRWEGHKVYLVDGTTITLPHTSELLKQYPPCENRSGKSHFPKMNICCAHDLITGVALRPEYGAMYGKNAVNEVLLFRRMLSRVTAGSVVVADRAYGIFIVINAAIKHGNEVVVRLTEDRARRFFSLMKSPGEIEVSWGPSSNEIKKYSELNKQDVVLGRFIWHRLVRKGHKTIDLYLFTTLKHDISKIVELYGLRWNVENDIRDLKHCLNLDEVPAKTPEMVHKEVILAYAAFNLIKHVISIAAGFHNIEPRRVGFKRVVDLIALTTSRFSAVSLAEQNTFIDRFIQLIPDLTNKIRKRPPQVRKKLYKREKFPPLKNRTRNLAYALKFKLN